MKSKSAATNRPTLGPVTVGIRKLRRASSFAGQAPKDWIRRMQTDDSAHKPAREWIARTIAILCRSRFFRNCFMTEFSARFHERQH